MERLALEGLLEPVETGGFSAREFSIRDIQDAIEARGVLEGTAARLAAERLMDSHELDSARRINSELAGAADSRRNKPSSEEMLHYASLNLAFHAAIVNLAKSPMLRWTIDRIQSIPFASPGAVVIPSAGGGSGIAVSQHNAILEAIDARDGAKAERLMREHAGFARRSVESALAGSARLRDDSGQALIRDAASRRKKSFALPPVSDSFSAEAPEAGEPFAAPENMAEQILDTAAALFCEKGYGRTTTREIAASLGIQQASLYHHVAGKEDLLYRLCRTSLEQCLNAVPSAIAAVRDPAARISALISAHLGTLLEHQKRNLTMLTELRSLSRGHRAEVDSLRNSYSAFVQSEIESAQAQGLLRSDVPAKYLRLALLNILNWTPRWFRAGAALSPAELAELYAKFFLFGAGASSRAASTRLPDLAIEGSAGKRRYRTRRSPRSSTRSSTQEMVNVAAELFSEKGYAATSMRDVAALVGIEKTSLYHHVESKEDLLYTICKSSVASILSDVSSALEGLSDPGARIDALIRAHCDSLLNNRAQHATALAESSSLSPTRRSEVVALQTAYGDLVRKELSDAQQAGILRNDIDPRYLGRLFQGLLNRTLVWYRPSGALRSEQLAQLLLDLFLSGAAR